MQVTVLLPCYNDAPTAIELIREAADSLRAAGHEPSFVVVDDGSSPPISQHEGFSSPEISVLTLKRNLGHQRGIACGLCHISELPRQPDAVVVMDSDGEDKPDHIPQLVGQIALDAEPRVVFAERAKRSENIVFRVSYSIYLALHAAFVGHAPRVGNFTALDSRLLGGLVTDADLWSHYAATLWKSNWKKTYVPLDRGTRRRGKSKLNFTSLVLHGLTAISCYWERISLRLLFLHGGCAFLSGLLFFILTLAAPYSQWRLWSGISGIAFFMLTMLSVGDCLRALNRRNQMSVLPIRDYRNFIQS